MTDQRRRPQIDPWPRWRSAGFGAKLTSLPAVLASLAMWALVDVARAQPAPVAPKKSGAPAAPAPEPAPAISGAEVAGFMDPFDYDPRGRRDPFAPPTVDKPVAPGGLHGPVLPLQRHDVAALRLTGVIWDVSRPRAMIEAPDGTTHVVGMNAKLGPKNGYIAAIREGEIVVVETEDRAGKLSSTTTVVKIGTGPSAAK